MKPPKDLRFQEYTIKIGRIRSAEKTATGYNYKDKMSCVEIVDRLSGTKTSFCESTMRKLFKRIKERLYL